MRPHAYRRLAVGLTLSGVVFVLAYGASVPGVTNASALAQPLPAQAAAPAKMKVITASSHATVSSLQSIIEVRRGWRDPDPFDDTFPGQAAPGGGNPGGGGGGTGSGLDPVLQATYPSTVVPPPVASFQGIGVNGGSPSDANLAVGTTQVVEMVNTMFQVFDKSGVSQAPAAKINTLFSALTDSPCSFANGGDPIVLFDQLANRWLLSQLEFPRVVNGVSNGVEGQHVCVAVSTTVDALGAYNLYDFVFDPAGEDLPDYPKFGVWPDAYYFSANTFRNGTFIGGQACAFDRNAMLAGADDPTVVCFQGNSSFHSLLPSGLDGSTPPPAGSPNYFLQFDCCTSLSLYKFSVNFTTPTASSFSGPVSIAVGRFATPGGGNVVPQPGTTDKLEDIGGGRLLYRLSYRNFGAYESLLVSHSVKVNQTAPAGSQSGIRWYEIRNPNALPKGAKGGPLVYQQSTFSPDSTTWRWMGSIGQDKRGNMLLGYSASSTTVFPSIRYTGRRAGIDPLNQMESEGTIFIGTGSQLINPDGNGRNRWGDYTSVAVDPVDDCTLWYVNQYIPFDGFRNWVTHLASFKFENCQ